MASAYVIRKVGIVRCIQLRENWAIKLHPKIVLQKCALQITKQAHVNIQPQ